MTEPDRVELVPARARLLIQGWVTLSTHAVGLLVALPFADRPALTLGLFGGVAVLFAAISFAGHRYALRRVSVPPPLGAVKLRNRFPTATDVATAGIAVLIVGLSMFGIVSAAILGIGFGSSFATLWAASKIAEFERDSQQRVLRKVGPRFGGDPGLYATPRTGRRSNEGADSAT
ncbi:MAG: hypothetical protein LC808_10250 [Actinobacteria bacterium]|nr:hypothetical protein [Actinomycetota bacterium]